MVRGADVVLGNGVRGGQYGSHHGELVEEAVVACAGAFAGEKGRETRPGFTFSRCVVGGGLLPGPGGSLQGEAEEKSDHVYSMGDGGGKECGVRL